MRIFSISNSTKFVRFMGVMIFLMLFSVSVSIDQYHNNASKAPYLSALDSIAIQLVYASSDAKQEKNTSDEQNIQIPWIHHNNKNFEKLTDETICSLSNNLLQYNCAIKWRLIVYNSNYVFCGYDEFKQPVKSGGCAIYKQNTILLPLHTMNTPDPIIPGNTVLEHELLHLECQCNFHLEYDLNPSEYLNMGGDLVKQDDYYRDKDGFWIPNGITTEEFLYKYFST